MRWRDRSYSRGCWQAAAVLKPSWRLGKVLGLGCLWPSGVWCVRVMVHTPPMCWSRHPDPIRFTLGFFVEIKSPRGSIHS